MFSIFSIFHCFSIVFSYYSLTIILLLLEKILTVFEGLLKVVVVVVVSAYIGCLSPRRVQEAQEREREEKADRTRQDKTRAGSETDATGHHCAAPRRCG